MITEYTYSFWSEPITACILCFCFLVLSVEIASEHPFWMRYDEQFANILLAVRIRRVIVLLTVALLLGLTVGDVIADRYGISLAERVNMQTFMCVSLTLLVFLMRMMLYKIVNFTFFLKEQNREWENLYSNVYRVIGYCLFVQYILFTYLNVGSTTNIIFTVLCFILAKIVLLFHALRIFSNKLYGILHLIMYFCALEIVPSVFIWYGAIPTNNIFY